MTYLFCEVNLKKKKKKNCQQNQYLLATSVMDFKAYIPSQCEPLHVGVSRWSRPPSDDFTLPITTCWYLKKKADPTQTPIYPMRPPIYQRDPQREPVEYGSRWVCESWVYIGHVDFMLFVSISFALGSQCKLIFWWNMGLSMDGIIWQLVPSFKGTVPPNPLCLVLTLLGL